MPSRGWAVSVMPGATALTRIWCGANAMALARVRNPLEAQELAQELAQVVELVQTRQQVLVQLEQQE